MPNHDLTLKLNINNGNCPESYSVRFSQRIAFFFSFSTNAIWMWYPEYSTCDSGKNGLEANGLQIYLHWMDSMVCNYSDDATYDENDSDFN